MNSEEDTVGRIYYAGYKETILEILALSNGEVINGTLKGMIDTEEVKKLLTKVEETK